MNLRELEHIDTVYDIRFGDIAFKYHLCSGDLECGLQQLYSLKEIDSFIIISDINVGKLYGQKLVKLIQTKFKCDLLMLECTEKHKNPQALGELLEKVLSLKATRRTCIIGLGGGICGNMSGMVAALLFRGIKFVHIPTSLMAVLDSVLSLKQAINSSRGKNLIGVFYTPEMVITDIDFLKTLPKQEVVSGLCEVIKNALAILPDTAEPLYKMLNAEGVYSPEDYRYVIDMSIKAKMLVMKNDPFEKHDALILEYGHTIGHAIELAYAGRISHGEAVGIGMMCAAEISNMLGYLPEKEVDLHKAILEKAGAPTKMTGSIQTDTILSIMKFDNKRGYVDSEEGVIHMVLLESIGKPLMNKGKLLTAVPDAIIRQALARRYE